MNIKALISFSSWVITFLSSVVVASLSYRAAPEYVLYVFMYAFVVLVVFSWLISLLISKLYSLLNRNSDQHLLQKNIFTYSLIAFSIAAVILNI